MNTGIRFDRKMSEAEGLMWRLDKDPYLTSTFANLSVLDRAPDFDRLRRRMERASIAIPRLRQRVQSSPANLTPPLWVDDPDFDIDYHVRRVSLPAPGSMRQMLDMATLITNDPFDRTRPLWQFVVIEGLEETNESFLSHRVNDALRVLTAITVIVLPLTLIASIFGMNVGLPGGSEPEGGSLITFIAVIAIMLAVLVGMFTWFRKRRWL